MTDGTGSAPKSDNQAFSQSPSPQNVGSVYGGPGTGTGQSTPSFSSMAPNAPVSPYVINGASWFYWIAALSLVNSAIALSGAQWHFIIGMGVTEVMDYIGNSTGGIGKAAAFAINLVIAGVVALFGVFARRGQKWAFLVGGALYAIDGVLLLLLRDFLSAGFHAYALFFIFRGFKHIND